MRKLALLGGILGLGLVVIGLTVWILFTSRASGVLRTVQEQIRQQAGADFQAAGGVSLSLFPHPAAVFRDVKLTARGDLPLIAAPELRLTLPWSALFSRQPMPTRIDVDQPSINLLIDNKGATSWTEFAVLSGDAPLYIDGGAINWLDERSGQSLRISDVDLRIAKTQPGELSISGDVQWNKQPVTVETYVKSIERLMEDGSPATITLKAPLASLIFDGRLGFARGLSLVGTGGASTTDAAGLLAWTGAGGLAPAITAWQVDGAVDLSPERMSLSQAHITAGAVKADGQVNADWTGERHRISLDLTAKEFDLATFGAWRIDPAVLRSRVESDIVIKAGMLLAGGVPLGPATVTTKILDGTLKLEIPTFPMYGGTAMARISLSQINGAPAVALDLIGDKLDAKGALAAFGRQPAIEGAASVTLSLSATGTTLDRLVASAAGSGHIAFGPGSLNAVDVGKLAADIGQAIVDGWPSAQNATPFDRLSASFTVRDGIAGLTDFVLDSPTLDVSATGDIDVPRQAVDLKLDPKLSNAEGGRTGLPVSIVMSGPWGHPKFYPDLPGLLDDPKAGYEALRRLMQPPAAETP